MASLALILTGLDAFFQEIIAIMAIIRLFGADFNTDYYQISQIMKVSITFDREGKENNKKQWVREIQAVVDRLNTKNARK